MAGQIYGFNQVFDSNGDPLPGAKLITRVPGTTTPKATYNAPDLLTPLTNPVIADSAGRFPQMWAAEGSIFDLVLTDENDVTIESFESVAALGTSSGDINVDFGFNGRFQVVGHSGKPNIEFGGPTGDDVGGDGRIGGWNNTQGDTLELDFATVEFTGFPTVGGFTEPYPRKLASGTQTAVASFDLPLSNNFQRWQLRLDNLITSAGATVEMRLSFDNGATYKAAAGDYVYMGMQANNVSPVTNVVVTSADHMRLGLTAPTQTAGGSMYTVQIESNTGEETRSISTYCNFSSVANDNVSGQASSSTNNKNYGKATNIRILVSGGTFSTRYALMGVP